MTTTKTETLCNVNENNISLVFNCITDTQTNNTSFEIKGHIRK